jgi:phage terminase large subunit-like protein
LPDISTEGFSTKVPLAEIVRLGALDNDLFARTFFPAAARQRAPLFHKEMDELLDNPAYRKVNLNCFRGSAKTTKLRIFAAKRIAYGISRTILYVGASEAHASRSIQWLRSQIDEKMDADGVKRRPLFAQAFGLQPGKKWTDTEVEIEHTITGKVVWVLGAGITGNIRGINFANYRPDLIVLDDVVTDENAATADQREKITDLVLGAVANSLAPETEEPNAKIAILQTPLHPTDVSARAAEARDWKTATFGCWTRGTRDLPVDMQDSAWAERYPTPILRREKKAAIDNNSLSKFLREMECRLTSPEVNPFKSEWLRYRDGPVPLRGLAVLSIDPVPPPSDKAVRKRSDTDFEAQVVWRRANGQYHLVECVVNRGHEPSWSVTTALSLAYKHRVARIVLENIGYERTLKWLLETEMKRRGVYYMISDVGDKTRRLNKHARIVGALQGPASQSALWVDKSMAPFIEQFVAYRLGIDHDDILDASANALMDLISPYVEMSGDEYAELWDDSDVPPMKLIRRCP